MLVLILETLTLLLNPIAFSVAKTTYSLVSLSMEEFILGNMLIPIFIIVHRPIVTCKSVYLKFNFLISQSKHMLWVLKRTVSMRRFF